MRILHYPKPPGLPMWDAIIAAGLAAGKNGYDGYSVDCPDCGRLITDCMGPQECEQFRTQISQCQ